MKVPSEVEQGSDPDTPQGNQGTPSMADLLMARAIMSKLAMDTKGMNRPSTNIEDDRSGDFAKAVTPIIAQEKKQRIQDAKDRVRGTGNK